MEKLIMEMIKNAEIHKDYELAEFIKRLLYQFAITCNCPSNWRNLKETIAEQYNDGWIYEQLELWDL